MSLVFAAGVAQADGLTDVTKATGQFNWSGSYVGVVAGRASGKSTATEARTLDDNPLLCDPTSTPGNYVCNVNGAAHVVSTPTPSYNKIGDTWGMTTQGSVLGISAGFNQQIGKFVWGGEVDWMMLRLKGVSDYSLNSDDTTLKTDASSVATARLKLGYAFDRAFVYATAGGAAGNFNSQVRDADIPIGMYTEKSNMQFAPVVGVGGEYALTDHVVLKVDFLRMLFGSTQVTGPVNVTCTTGASVCNPNFWKTFRAGWPSGGFASWDISQRLDLSRVGVAYKF